MKKLIYTGAMAVLAIGFVACSEAAEELSDVADEMEMTDVDEVSEEKTEELNNVLEIQEKVEGLDADLDQFIESIK